MRAARCCRLTAVSFSKESALAKTAGEPSGQQKGNRPVGDAPQPGINSLTLGYAPDKLERAEGRAYDIKEEEAQTGKKAESYKNDNKQKSGYGRGIAGGRVKAAQAPMPPRMDVQLQDAP